MTDQDYRNSVLNRLHDMEQAIAELTKRLVAVETKSAVDEVHRQNVEQRLGSIERGISKLFWLFGGGLVMAVATFILNGGLAQ